MVNVVIRYPPPNIKFSFNSNRACLCIATLGRAPLQSV
jgi:hypothetical protein